MDTECFLTSEIEDTSPDHCLTLDNAIFFSFLIPYREWHIQFGVSAKYAIFLAWKKRMKANFELYA